MFFRLLTIFAVIPLIELYLLIEVGGRIGALNTIAIIFITATAGAYLARKEGFQAIQDIKQAFNSGRMPAQELLHGLFIMIGAFTLLTPGFLTDLMGLSMLLRPIRQTYVSLAQKYFGSVIQSGGTQTTSYQDITERP